MTGIIPKLAVYGQIVLGQIAYFGEKLSDIHARYSLPAWLSKFTNAVAAHLVALELAKLGVFGGVIQSGVSALLG
jgi:hypothetical protein